MEPIIIVTAAAICYYTYIAIVDTLRDLRRESGKYPLRPEPVKIRCRDNAYNERYMRNEDRW